jgi:hypothetical protein
VKNEECEEENAIIEAEEIVLDTVDTSSHMLPVIVEEAETSVVEEIIQVRRIKFVRNIKYIFLCILSMPVINVFYRVLDPLAMPYFEIEFPILWNKERSMVLLKSFLYKSLKNM